MEIIIYVAIFLTGIVFGSFFTLAVYRIPRGENIVYGRSHCTSCGHKLSLLDLIPVLSYIFLGGKCRYCGEKIRIRYLLLEIFSGIVFLLIALTHGLTNIIELCLIYLFVAGMFIIAGIDREKLIIPNGLCIYELGIAIVKIIYDVLLNKYVFENLIGLIAVPIILFTLDRLIVILKKNENNIPVGYGDIKYLAVIGLMFGYKIQLMSIALSSLIMLVGIIIHRYKEIPWGYFLSISTLIIIIIEPYISELVELI